MKTYKKIDKKTLQHMIEQHKLAWLHDEEGGELADFSGLDLSGVDFSDCILMEALFNDCDLTGANFSNSLLCYAEFTGANCSYVDFSDADMTGAELRGANLMNANFDNVIREE